MVVAAPEDQCHVDSAAPVRERMDASVLFIDVIASSRITRHVEEHHGPELAAELFTSYLLGCMRAINRVAPDAECQPSGDAVLAIIPGAAKERIPRAIEAAAEAIRFVTDEFGPRNQRLLSCPRTHRWCHGTLRFEVSAGIDDGVVTKSDVLRVTDAPTQLVGACVNNAAKVSDKVGSVNSIGITADAYQRGDAFSMKGFKWRSRIYRIGGKSRHIRITVPAKS